MGMMPIGASRTRPLFPLFPIDVKSRRRIRCRWCLQHLVAPAFLLSAFSLALPAQVATVKRNVNLREGPSTQHKIIRLLEPSEELQVLDLTPTGGYYNVVTVEEEEGWVWERNITIDPDAALEAARYEALRVHVVDVGQGDGILIRTPNEHWVLIDAGSGHLLANLLPTEFGVPRLDVAILSHRHLDHGGGMHRALDILEVDEFWGDTSSADAGQRMFMKNLRKSIKASHTPVSMPKAEGTHPDTLTVDGVQLVFLPLPPYDPGNENNNTLVVRVDYGGFSMLFSGDAEEDERKWLVEHFEELLDTDVLKASHHGSHNGTSEDWLTAVSPEYVVISAGVHKGFRHPHPEAVQAYLTAAAEGVFCTNRHSTIQVYGYPDGRVSVSTLFDSPKSCAYDGTHHSR